MSVLAPHWSPFLFELLLLYLALNSLLLCQAVCLNLTWTRSWIYVDFASKEVTSGEALCAHWEYIHKPNMGFFYKFLL
jgi:hypothetical protein